MRGLADDGLRPKKSAAGACQNRSKSPLKFTNFAVRSQPDEMRREGLCGGENRGIFWPVSDQYLALRRRSTESLRVAVEMNCPGTKYAVP
jgi:hypothetical protein